MGSAMTLSFTPLGILLWLGVVIFLSVFASIMPARNAVRLTINEVLAYGNCSGIGRATRKKGVRGGVRPHARLFFGFSPAGLSSYGL